MATLAESPRLRAGLVLLLVFGAGLAVGLTIARRPPPHRPPAPPFLTELGLSDEQRARAHEIFERHRPEVDEVLRASQPKFDEIQRKVEAELDALLTPAQRAQARARRATGQSLLPPPGGPGAGLPPPPGGPGAGLPPPPG